MEKFSFMTLIAFSAITLNGASFQFAEQPACTSQAPGAASTVFGDLNGDGRPDMAVNSVRKAGERTESAVLLFYNAGGRLPEIPDRTLAFSNCFSLAIYDFDQDGTNDIGAVIGGDVCFFMNKNGFDPVRTEAFHTGNQINDSMQVCRINSQGSYDVLVAPVWRTFFVKGGRIRAESGYILGPHVNDTGRTLAADVNADGSMDVIARSRGTGDKLYIYYGPLVSMRVNPGELSDFLELAVACPPSSLAVADMNGDGLPDLVVSGGPKTCLYFQNQPIGFDADAAPSVTLAAGGSIIAEDLDGDKLCDLVVLDGGSRALIFFQKKGQEFPSDPAQADQALKIPRSGALFLEDIDGDGAKDLIARGIDGRFRIYCGKQAETGVTEGAKPPTVEKEELK
ncbi:MAG: VCBS repeat-containing protein [Kiritimatiellae bacterium]|nr:VCBS repeat-containing protein [Kiritimatiellia bacterium]